jgi:hypothetical protein
MASAIWPLQQGECAFLVKQNNECRPARMTPFELYQSSLNGHQSPIWLSLKVVWIGFEKKV